MSRVIGWVRELRLLLDGLRNWALVVLFQVWVVVYLWMMAPPSGLTPELIASHAQIILIAAGLVASGIGLRAVNKYVDTKKPGIRGPLTVIEPPARPDAQGG